jgi:Flp pilus assembly pilin Flp
MTKHGILSDTRGTTSVEYVMLLCLVAVFGLVSWQSFGATIESRIAGAERTLRDEGGLGLATGGPTPGAYGPIGAARAGLGVDDAGDVGNRSSGATRRDPIGDGIRDGASQFVRDTIDGVGAIAGGVYHAATNPRATGAAVWDAITHPRETAAAVASTASAVVGSAVDSAVELVDAVRRGDAYAASRAGTLIATSFIPAGPVVNGVRGVRAATAAAGTVERAAGAAVRARAPTAVRDTGYGTRATWDGDPHAMVAFETDGRGVVVSDIFRGAEPRGTAGQMLADSLRIAGQPRPTTIRLSGIINKPTLEALERGATPAETLLGSTVGNAARELGGSITGWSVGSHRGKTWIEAAISYP